MKKTIIKFFLIFFLFFNVISNSSSKEIEINMPAAPGVTKYFQNIQNGVKNFSEKSSQKIKKFNNDLNNTVTKTTGKPTGENLSKMSKKEKEQALLNARNNGYYGILPDIEREFDYLKQNSKKIKPKEKYKDGSLDEMNLKKAPYDDLFLDVILNKQKDTQYTKDVLKILTLFQRFRNCISENCDIQQFNGNVNLIDLYAKRLEKDYSNSPESSSESYYLIRNIAYLAKLQGNLKYDSNFYSKYMPLEGTVYSKDNVRLKDEELLNELDKTIFLLQQLK